MIKIFFLIFIIFVNFSFAVIYQTNDHSCPSTLPTILVSKSAPETGLYVDNSGTVATFGGVLNCGSSGYQFFEYSGVSFQDPYFRATMTIFSYSYVSSCPTGQTQNADGVCQSPQCPVGKILDASGKYCVPETCPVGSTRDPITLHCLPIKCPTGQTLISDGTCQTTCPPNSSRVGKICLYDCGHWSKDQCGKYTDSKGNTCKWSYGNLFQNSFSGSCVTETQANKDIEQLLPLKLSPSNLPKIFGEPAYPEYEPMPIKPYEPVTLPIPKPANDPNYVPPVEPIPVEPIPVKPVEPIPEKPANDPDYVPTIEPVTPLTPDIVPYVPPVPEPLPLPAPAPVPLPAPEVLPAPVPSPAPLPAPAPSPIAVPLPAPLPSPVPLPMPKPDYTFDPLPEPAPAPDPVYDPITGELIPAPAPVPSPYPVAEPLPNVAMPGVPDVLDFSIDDMDRFRYQAALMGDNILDQVDNVQNTFTNTMSVLDQGFPPVSLPSGTCGSSMAFNFYGRHIDLCPPLAESSAQFAPLFQLLIFLVGLIASIKIFISGLRD